MNGVAACLEYDTSSCMTPTFSSLDGHNAIWTSWDFLQIPTWPKAKTKNFLLWINSNRLCLHLGLKFVTIFSFTCSKIHNFCYLQILLFHPVFPQPTKLEGCCNGFEDNNSWVCRTRHYYYFFMFWFVSCCLPVLACQLWNKTKARRSLFLIPQN